MSTAKLFLLSLLSAVLGAGLVMLVFNPGTTQQAEPESAYERVLRTNTIRCGYFVQPPHVFKDSQHEPSRGIIVDIMNKVAEYLKVDIEWVEEVGRGNMITGIQTDRYEMVCTAVWANASRSKGAGFTTPLYYSGVGVFVNYADDRFDGKPYSVFNSPEVTAATMDGSTNDFIARTLFPQAQRFSLPENSSIPEVILQVGEGKADVVFTENYAGYLYMQNNPEKLKNLALEDPLTVFPNTMLIPNDDVQFANMINTTLEQIINSGAVDEIIAKYVDAPNLYYPVVKPYEVPTIE